jgi:hypothetical protein
VPGRLTAVDSSLLHSPGKHARPTTRRTIAFVVRRPLGALPQGDVRIVPLQPSAGRMKVPPDRDVSDDGFVAITAGRRSQGGRDGTQNRGGCVGMLRRQLS